MKISQTKKLFLTLNNLGFETSKIKRAVSKIGEMQYTRFSFDLKDKTTIHIEAMEGEMLGPQIVMVREVSPDEKQVLIKDALDEAALDKIPMEIASLMIKF